MTHFCESSAHGAGRYGCGVVLAAADGISAAASADAQNIKQKVKIIFKVFIKFILLKNRVVLLFHAGGRARGALQLRKLLVYQIKMYVPAVGALRLGNKTFHLKHA